MFVVGVEICGFRESDLCDRKQGKWWMLQKRKIYRSYTTLVSKEDWTHVGRVGWTSDRTCFWQSNRTMKYERTDEQLFNWQLAEFSWSRNVFCLQYRSMFYISVLHDMGNRERNKREFRTKSVEFEILLESRKGGNFVTMGRQKTLCHVNDRFSSDDQLVKRISAQNVRELTAYPSHIYHLKCNLL